MRKTKNKRKHDSNELKTIVKNEYFYFSGGIGCLISMPLDKILNKYITKSVSRELMASSKLQFKFMLLLVGICLLFTGICVKRNKEQKVDKLSHIGNFGVLAPLFLGFVTFVFLFLAKLFPWKMWNLMYDICLVGESILISYFILVTCKIVYDWIFDAEYKKGKSKHIHGADATKLALVWSILWVLFTTLFKDL